MSFLLSFLIWISGSADVSATQLSSNTALNDKAQTHILQDANNPKHKWGDLTGGTSIIVVLDDTEYRPIHK